MCVFVCAVTLCPCAAQVGSFYFKGICFNTDKSKYNKIQTALASFHAVQEMA